MGRISKFFLLTGPEKLIFCRAVYLLVYFRIALHRQHFQTLVDRLMISSGGGHLPASALIPADTIIQLLAAAGRLIPFSTCLSRAMAGQRLLMRYGHFPALHIGVAREEGENLEAHAWLSLEGRIILGSIPDIERYRELPPLQGGGSKGP